MIVEKKVTELCLADEVDLQFCDHRFDTATVVRITDEEVTMIRPYIHTSDCAYSTGLIWYTGHEEIKYQKSWTRTFRVVHGKELK